MVTDGTEVNMLHGSDSMESAEKDLDFFFPVEQTVAVIKPDAYDNKGRQLPTSLRVYFNQKSMKRLDCCKKIVESVFMCDIKSNMTVSTMSHYPVPLRSRVMTEHTLCVRFLC